jgi:hypothetical protein
VSPNEQKPHPLVTEGGISGSPSDSRASFEVLDDLMQVIEALCPTYPQRDTFPDGAIFKL